MHSKGGKSPLWAMLVLISHKEQHSSRKGGGKALQNTINLANTNVAAQKDFEKRFRIEFPSPLATAFTFVKRPTFQLHSPGYRLLNFSVWAFLPSEMDTPYIAF